MIFKKKVSQKFVALALLGIIISTPIFNTVYAMDELQYNELCEEISYSEIIKNIDYEEIDFSSNARFSIPNVVLSIMKIIPKILKYGDRAVDLAKFTIKVGKTKLKNKKTGWYIEKDRAGSNSHGGSAYKLFNNKGEREATLDKNGKVLRK
jgi:hypothetical protein